MDLLDEKVLKKHRPDLIEYMKVSYIRFSSKPDEAFFYMNMLYLNLIAS